MFVLATYFCIFYFFNTHTPRAGTPKANACLRTGTVHRYPHQKCPFYRKATKQPKYCIFTPLATRKYTEAA